MNGSRIMMTPEPKGIFMEGTPSLTGGNLIYPGSVVSLVAGTAPISGDFSWGLYSPGANGNPSLIVVAIEDMLEGFPFSTAYTSSSTRIFLYIPENGEFLNMAVTAEAGTGAANAYTIGERMIVANNTGLLVSQGTAANPSQFMVMEAVTITPDVVGWVWCMRTYNN